MKRLLLTGLCVLCCLWASAQKNVIFETDMGNDIDDAMAIDMLYKYDRMGKINLKAVMINKEGMYPPMYIDVLNNWYGFRKLPIGISNPAALTLDEENFAKAVVTTKDEKGREVYKRRIKDLSRLPEAYKLYRKLLAEAPDHSVTIISVGFSTNLARLMESQPDEYSPSNGMQLISQKVDRLVTMAGYIAEPGVCEFNVSGDIAACQKVFAEWPTPVVTSPFDVGMKILYPGKSLKHDFGWTKHHPVQEGCVSYLGGYDDRPTWDLTAVLFAIDPGDRFNLSPAGQIEVTDEGYTHYHEDSHGNRYYMITTPEQDKKILAYFVDMIPRQPRSFK